MLLTILSSLLLASRATALGPPTNSIRNIVTFGDSYTLLDTGDPTRTAWPILLAGYANLTVFGFAQSGATCNQSLTPRIYPAVVQDELPAYFDAFEAGNITGTAEDTLYTIWIGWSHHILRPQED